MKGFSYIGIIAIAFAFCGAFLIPLLILGIWDNCICYKYEYMISNEICSKKEAGIIRFKRQLLAFFVFLILEVLTLIIMLNVNY